MKSLNEALIDLVERGKQDKNKYADHVWNIVTALRGPDLHAEDEDVIDLKHLTTCRVRSIFLDRDSVESDISGLNIQHMNAMGYINTCPLSDELIEKRNALLDDSPSHFVYHFFDALIALIRLGYSVPVKELPRQADWGR